MNMKTFRNIAFLALFGAVMISGPQTLYAIFDPPTFYDCPEGCDCQVDPWNPNQVHIECEDGAPADMCWIIWDACDFYCYDTFEYWVNNVQQPAPPEPVQCYLESTDGCDPPYSLEPPTSTTCECWCYY
jgi:hypothetical protein